MLRGAGLFRSFILLTPKNGRSSHCNSTREFCSNSRTIRYLLQEAIQNKNILFLDGVLAKMTSNKYSVNGIDCYQLCKAYIELNQQEQPKKILEYMESSGIAFNSIMASSFPRLCENRKMIGMATKIYDLILKSGTPLTTKIQTSLLAMFGRCGDVSKSQLIFHLIQQQDTFSVSAMMSVFMRNNLFDKGIEFFHQEILPNIHTINPDNYFWETLISACITHHAPQKAIEIFQMIKAAGVRLDAQVYASIIQVCSQTKQFHLVKELHGELIQSGTIVSTLMQNNLINIYCKSGNFKLAEEIFFNLRKQNRDDIASWNTILGSLIKNGHYIDAIRHFKELQTSRIQPSLITFTLVLVAVTHTGDLSLGKIIHGQVHKLLPSSALLRNRLMEMYGTCGEMPMAQSLFQKMHQEKQLDTYSWNIIIKVLSRHKLHQQALEYYCTMKKEGFAPDETTFSLILPCVSSLDVGVEIHEQIRLVRGESLPVKNCLIEMYGRCGDIQSALSIFNSLHHQADQYSWNIILNAFCANKIFDKVISYFNLMQQAGIPQSEITYGIIIETVVTLKDIELARTILPKLLRTVPLPVIPLHRLMNLFEKQGDLATVQSLFQALRASKQVDIYSYNILLHSFYTSGSFEAALECFCSMQRDDNIQPTEVTFSVILSVVIATENLEFGKQVHQQIIHQMGDPPSFLLNKLIEMYGKCQQIDIAQDLFHKIRQSNKADEYTWNIMLTVFSLHHRYAEAIDCFESMIREGVNPTEATFTIILGVASATENLAFGKQIHQHIMDHIGDPPVILLNMLLDIYRKCGQLDIAQILFDQIRQSKKADEYTWNIMLSVFTLHSQYAEVIDCFNSMIQEGVNPTEATFTIILRVVTILGDIAFGMKIHTMIINQKICSTAVFNQLMSMYAKCDQVITAMEIFEYMKLVKYADIRTWNIMINAFGWRGEANEALKLFHQFIAEGNQPDKVTMAALLNACSHAGFVDTALELFHSMKCKYAIEPEDVHQTIIIDTLSRANRLDEAESYLAQMIVPTPAAYMAILGGCRKFSDAERARRMVQHLNRINPSDAAAHVLLANIYSKTGHWEEWAQVRNEISSQQLKKPPGMSWGVINGVLYTYLAKIG